MPFARADHATEGLLAVLDIDTTTTTTVLTAVSLNSNLSSSPIVIDDEDSVVITDERVPATDGMEKLKMSKKEVSGSMNHLLLEENEEQGHSPLLPSTTHTLATSVSSDIPHIRHLSGSSSTNPPSRKLSVAGFGTAFVHQSLDVSVLPSARNGKRRRATSASLTPGSSVVGGGGGGGGGRGSVRALSPVGIGIQPFDGHAALVPQRIAEAAAVFNAASNSAAAPSATTAVDSKRGSGSSSPSLLSLERDAPPWDVFQNLMQETADNLSQSSQRTKAAAEQGTSSSIIPAKRLRKG